MDNILQLLTPELDYQALFAALRSGYKDPKQKINLLLKKGEIIRVKKGLYVLGNIPGHPQYSTEVLANLVYGPSYISLQYALAYYQFIPEKVTVLTSVTTQRTRAFTTPVGRFTYQHIPAELYREEFSRVAVGDRSFLMASKEKALVDMLFLEQKTRSIKQLKELLVENLRINIEDVTALNIAALEAIQGSYQHSSIEYLIKLVRGKHE